MQRRERLKFLKTVLNVQTTSRGQENMIQFIQDTIDSMHDKSIHYHVDDDNIYVTKGEAETYPCVVSHMDTVHSIVDDFRIYQHEDILFAMDTDSMEQTGIGGDDKVGVFCCLEALIRLPVVKLAFFRDEEIGCQGSGVADMTFFEDVSFVLQADRKGYKDFVRTISGIKLYSKEFGDAILPVLEKYGKEEVDNGGLTDVKELKIKNIDVCVANSSCGYYSPHRDEEVVIVTEVFATSSLFVDIINEVYTDGERWVHKYVKSVPTYPNFNRRNSSVGRVWKNGRFVDEPTTYWWNDPMNPFYDEYNPHWNEETDKVIHSKITCTACKSDVTDDYDEYEDGYWCHTCDEYRFLNEATYSRNNQNPSDDIIKKKIIAKGEVISTIKKKEKKKDEEDDKFNGVPF